MARFLVLTGCVLIATACSSAPVVYDRTAEYRDFDQSDVARHVNRLGVTQDYPDATELGYAAETRLSLTDTATAMEVCRSVVEFVEARPGEDQRTYQVGVIAWDALARSESGKRGQWRTLAEADSSRRCQLIPPPSPAVSSTT